jgi:hypothetical protein
MSPSELLMNAAQKQYKHPTWLQTQAETNASICFCTIHDTQLGRRLSMKNEFSQD